MKPTSMDDTFLFLLGEDSSEVKEASMVEKYL